MFRTPQFLFARHELAKIPLSAKGDVAVGMGVEGLNFLQQECSDRGREPVQHENIVVRWEYRPDTVAKKAKSDAVIAAKNEAGALRQDAWEMTCVASFERSSDAPGGAS